MDMLTYPQKNEKKKKKFVTDMITIMELGRSKWNVLLVLVKNFNFL